MGPLLHWMTLALSNISAYLSPIIRYCRSRNFRVCLYIANIASGAASLYMKTLYFCLFLATGGADVNFRFSGDRWIAPLVNLIEDT